MENRLDELSHVSRSRLQHRSSVACGDAESQAGSIAPLTFEELEEEKAVHFAAEVNNRFTALDAAQNEVTPEDLWKGTKTVLLEVARETIGSVKSQKKKKWISDETFAAIREKTKAKGKDKNRYQELKAEVQKKLRVVKQQQPEGICMELEAANSKGNSRQLFQIVKSVTQKFEPRLQCIQSATGKNLTEAAQIADRWIRYCEYLYHDEEGKELNKNFGSKSIHHFIQRLLVPSIRQQAGKPQVLMRSQQNCSKQERRYWTECSEYVWQSGKLVSLQRNGRCPHSSHFPRKVILNCVQITEQLLLPPMQARSVFGSYWKE